MVGSSRLGEAVSLELPKIALECDGGQFKTGGGRHNSDSDREKLNNAALLGWRVVRFSTQQLYSNPKKCIEFLKKIILKSKEGVRDIEKTASKFHFL